MLTLNNLNAVFVNTCVYVLKTIFDFIIDFHLISTPIHLYESSFMPIFDNVFGNNRDNQQQQAPLKTVVIVGGNFSGLAALWELLSNSRDQKFKIVLIDQKEYSEYTPGILRLFCDPHHTPNIIQSLPTNPECSKNIQYQFIQGKVTSILKDDGNGVQKVVSCIPSATSSTKSCQTISYDYLIVATGSTYATPISPSAIEMTIQGRYNTWQNENQTLLQAQNILILGGGAVGVELAAEIIDHYPTKNITLIDGQSSLVPNFPQHVQKYAKQWLLENGISLLLNQKLKSWNDTSCTFDDGTTIETDIVYVCFGSQPNSSVLSTANNNQSSSLLVSLTRRHNVIVKDTLQVVLTSQQQRPSVASASQAVPMREFLHVNADKIPIFACGDVAQPPINNEKQAFQAEMQGKTAARNVLLLMKNQENAKDNQQQQFLYRYPKDLVGGGSCGIPLVFVLSLGRYDGILGLNNICIPGPLAAVVKWILEYTKVLHMKGELLGKVIWKIGDNVVLFLARTILPPLTSPTNQNPSLLKINLTKTHQSPSGKE
jgi:NADH dehydrogenase FAD-containing subunit